MLDKVLEFVQNESELITVIISFLLAHFGASAYVASTATKAGKLYKIIEALALVTKKAKEQAKDKGEL